MHMTHLAGNTSVVSKSSLNWLNYTGFPGDVCVAFFNVPPGNKDAVVPNHSLEKKAVEFSTVTMSIYQDQLNAGFSKVCEIFNVCGIESLKCLRVLYCYCGKISTPLNNSMRPMFPDFQPSVWKSGYVRLIIARNRKLNVGYKPDIPWLHDFKVIFPFEMSQHNVKAYDWVDEFTCSVFHFPNNFCSLAT